MRDTRRIEPQTLLLAISFILFSILCATAPLRGQSPSEAAAYSALVSTPFGALPPTLSSAMLDEGTTHPNLGLRYGYLSNAGTNANAFDAKVAMPIGGSVAFALNGGYQALSCVGCTGHFIGGASAEGRLANVHLGSYADVARLAIGLNGEAGFGKRSGATAFSLTAGVPIALVSGPPSVRIAPFLTPGIGWGRLSDNANARSAASFVLGAGVVFQSVSTGIGAHIGFQRVFIRNGSTALGVGLIIGAR